MYIIDILWEIGKWAWEHRKEGVTWATITSLLWLIVDKMGRKLITNQLKRLFHVRDKSQFSSISANQIRIESKVDMLLKERGLVWDAHLLQTSRLLNETDGQKNSSKSTWAAFAPALIIGAFTNLMDRSFHFKIRGENTRMKSKLLSRKFLMALATGILIILNDGLDLGLDKETIMSVVAIIGGWIFVEGGTDIVKMRKEKNNADFETPVEPRV